jgi:hypothetical protein
VLETLARPPSLDLKTSGCRVLLDAWLAWRGDRLLPRRVDADPASLKPILPLVGILEVKSRQVATYRLAGSGLRDVFGFDASGKNSIDLVSERNRLRRAYRTYMPANFPCGYLGLSEFVYAEDISDRFESIGLPLAADIPGGPPFLIFTLESLAGRHWRKEFGTMVDNLNNDLRFFDIGAGIPPTVDPPADFLAAA